MLGVLAAVGLGFGGAAAWKAVSANAMQAAASDTNAAASSTPVSAPAASSAAPVSNPDLPADKSLWSLMLVNSTHAVPEGYDTALTFVAPDPNSQQLVDARIAPAMQEMFAAAQQAGYTLFLRSGYRSYDTQVYLFNALEQTYLAQGYSETDAYAMTKKLRNEPGYSEHQTGLTADIVPLRLANTDLVEALENEPEMQWLAAHCADYGFILRYPKGKTDITGTEYEPWHFRYVGVEDAKKIMESGMTLEEYLSQ